MEHAKKYWLAYLIVIGMAILIYRYLNWKSYRSNNKDIPSSFNGKSCSGISDSFSTYYYIENGKYYSRTSGGIAGIEGDPIEISKSEYVSAYNSSKIPCDPLIA